MKKTIVTSAALLSLALLAGCGSSDDGGKGDDKPADTGSQAPASDEKDGEHGLDTPYAYPDGFTVTLSNFERGKSSDTALPAETDFVRFTVQVENKTGKAVDLGLFTIQCKTGDDGSAAEEVFDEGLGGQLTGTVNDGKKATGDFACVLDPAETKLQIEVSPNYGDDITELPDTAVFNGEVAAK
ncbi:hypothetical protein [Phytomonospora endophytica]|uniref:DUF4352 domain-containing protein n=1 Tax=Phytomonospora endophytica TaxID=714109 RepID=A0A841FGM7_9ACTN|nr:hypothetical protein [Phytomonospora endophytica]MBB6034815.1 hypothetical protein [Phytomonospora endophytica]GIG68981.1 hypothetical protein Pen01_52760 [Phytomonospora endophytica]